MQPHLLGKKIKDLRLQKNMTQAELAGDTITRNMLSQIENGSAQPSVTTIMELAEKLDTPTEYFFSQTIDLPTLRKLDAIGKIRKLYGAGDYGKVISRLESLDGWDDETEYLFVKASYGKGMLLYREGFLSSAADCLEKALAHARNTIYADECFLSVVFKYLRVIARVLGREIDAYTAEGEIWMADIAYIEAIFGEHSNFSYGDTHPFHAKHLAVRKEMLREGTAQNRETMISVLKQILRQTEESQEAILRYYILSDLELLAKEIGDYKCAYECASERLHLAEKMNH